MGTTENVVIVGAGPTGLWLACELALAGIEPLVLERERSRSPHSKALGLHARSIEVLAMRGVAEEFLDAGMKVPSWHFGMLRSRLDLRSLHTPFPFMLGIPQARTEELLEKHAIELGVRIRRGVAVTGLVQDPDAVTLRTAEGVELRAAFVVGCDGAASAVRKAAGIAFPGTDSPAYGFLGDVALAEPPPPGFGVHNERGALIVAPLPDGSFRVTGYDPEGQGGDEPTFAGLRASAQRVAGTDFGMRDPVWLSRFGLAARQVDRYRAGRVLLAGDAAHMHPPAGGVGLNTGLQDAMNLGWKLAMVLGGKADGTLLDSYHDERHPVGMGLLASTQAQSALIMAVTPDGLALRSELETLIATVPELALRLANKLTALDVSYPAADPAAHPVVGARVADAAVLALLHGGAPVAVGALDEPGWAGVTAAVVRPDGHVGWATGTPAGPGLDDEVTAALARSPRW